MPVSPKSIKNLKPPKKGEIRNPNGRPKKIPALDTLLADVLGDEKEGVTAAQVILMALRQKAVKGDVRAAEVLLDRAYGKAKSNLDLTSKGESISPMTPQQFGEMVAVLNKAAKK